jgi:hypothetical protein
MSGTRYAQTAEDYIKSRITVDANGCWLLAMKPTKDGYVLSPRRFPHTVIHRLSYETFVGPIPQGLEIDHLCRVRNCVNPAHCYRGISFAAVNHKKTHCDHGHELSGDNLYIRPGNRRGCKTCNKEAARRYVARKKQQMQATGDAA